MLILFAGDFAFGKPIIVGASYNEIVFSYDANGNQTTAPNGKEEIAADAVVDSLLQISTIDKENVDKIKVLDSPSTYVRAL